MSGGTLTSSPTIRLQERDYAVLRGLFESRIATLKHLTDIHFDGRSEACKKRVQALKRSGYVRERPRSRPYDPSILFLGKKGYDALHKHGSLTDYPQIGWSSFEKRARVSEVTLKHELQVMDVKAAFYRAIAKEPHLHIAEFSTWPRLYQFKARPKPKDRRSRPVLVKPDGFIRVRESTTNATQSEYLFFLEVDRGTESLDVLAQRAMCYLDHYRSGGMAQQCGGSADEYKRYPFRVLIAAPSLDRLNNLAIHFSYRIPRLRSMIWLAEASDILHGLLAAIWHCPVNYGGGRNYLPSVRQFLLHSRNSNS